MKNMFTLVRWTSLTSDNTLKRKTVNKTACVLCSKPISFKEKITNGHIRHIYTKPFEKKETQEDPKEILKQQMDDLRNILLTN